VSACGLRSIQQVEAVLHPGRTRRRGDRIHPGTVELRPIRRQRGDRAGATWPPHDDVATVRATPTPTPGSRLISLESHSFQAAESKVERAPTGGAARGALLVGGELPDGTVVAEVVDGGRAAMVVDGAIDVVGAVPGFVVVGAVVEVGDVPGRPDGP